MTCIIRPSRAGDVPFLSDIERAAGALFADVPGLEWIAGDGVMEADRHRHLVMQGTHRVAAEATGRLIGFLAAERAEQALHIWEVSVHPDAHRQGVGRALIEAALAHARANSLTEVTLTTFIDVPWNAPYYARLGFALMRPDQCYGRLAGVLADEATHGLPRERRCAMRYSLLAPSAPAR